MIMIHFVTDHRILLVCSLTGSNQQQIILIPREIANMSNQVIAQIITYKLINCCYIEPFRNSFDCNITKTNSQLFTSISSTLWT